MLSINVKVKLEVSEGVFVYGETKGAPFHTEYGTKILFKPESGNIDWYPEDVSKIKIL